MSRTRSRRRSKRRSHATSTAKPRGVVHARVQAVGPEHFGIVCVDCAKERSTLMLADFYGSILIEPTDVEHTRPGLHQAVALVRSAFDRHQIRDAVVAIERTGRHHRHVQRAFAAAGWQTRIVHPFVTKHYRQPVDPGYKTDPTDLMAIHRATVTGCALLEEPLEQAYYSLRLLVRHRRDLVVKRAALQCQIRDHLQAILPGYADCFDDLFERPIAWRLLKSFPTAQALLAAGAGGLAEVLRRRAIRFQKRTLQHVLDWAQDAAEGEPACEQHRRIVWSLHKDHRHKSKQIRDLQRQMAQALCATPYVLLLSFPGINVVSAADFAGEMGPIQHYPNAKHITGRAGLCPSRYQSDQVDRADGPLRRQCNHSLRATILTIAENLINCNHHFGHLARRWAEQHKDARDRHVRVGLRFCRIAFQMVAGGQVFCHPGMQERHYVLDKLNAFHRKHKTPMGEVLSDLQNAIAQVPQAEHPVEAVPLAEELERIRAGRRRGPQPLADILPMVLARLQGRVLQSQGSGE